MNASWLIQLVQTPVVVYAVVLTIAWTLIQLASKISRRETKVWVNERFVLAALWIYMVLALAAIVIDVKIFPFLHSAMFALTLCAALSASPKRSAPLLTATLIVAFMPVVVMVSTKHPLPLGDDARFIGFAVAIESDGRWIPYKYPENPYYQLFHLIPAMEYVFASITGVSIESIAGIMVCYLTLKLTFYLAYFTLLFLIVRRLANSAASPLVAVLLLSITPPLALSQVVHQGYAIVLSLAMLLVMLRTQDKGSKADAVAEVPLWVSGIVAHATYTLMVLAFALPVLIADRVRVARFSEAVETLLAISLAYWVYTYVADIIVRPTVDAFNRLIDLITGRAHPFYGTAQPWYGQEQQSFFVAWALVPSMSASYILLSLLKFLFKRFSSKECNLFIIPKLYYISILGFLGLGGTVLNFALRMLPTFGGRYFYWLYLLMLSLSAFVATNVSKKLTSLIFSVALISAISFYGVQDPTLSANTYGGNIGWADRDSWSLALLLSKQLNPSIPAWIDPRLSTPLSSLKPSLTPSEEIKYQRVAIVGVDAVGLRAATKDPRCIDWFKMYMGVSPQDLVKKSLNKFDVILNCASYVGVYTR
jgi:hypothetical protein